MKHSTKYKDTALQLHIHQDPHKPSLFLLHGLGGRADQWRAQINFLKSKYSLIVPDLVGQDKNESYTFAAISQRITHIFNQYAGEHNIIMGHSYGGTLATALALQNPERIQKLILISPLNGEPNKKVPLLYFLSAHFLNIIRPYLDKSFERLAFDSHDKELLRIEREGRNKNDMAMIKAMLMGIRHIPQLPIQQLNMPALIIYGNNDRILSNNSMVKFYSALPQREFVNIQHAAHLPHLEQSEKVNAIIEKFMTQS